MNIEELREEYPKLPLSVLKRAIIISPKEPNIVEALREYADEKKYRPMPCERSYELEPAGKLWVVLVATEKDDPEEAFKRLAMLALTDDLDERLLNQTIAETGQNIKIYPVKKIDLKGNLTGWYKLKERYVVIIGIDANTKEVAEVYNTLVKNALRFIPEYVERSKVTEHIQVFQKFFLNHEIAAYDSVMEPPNSRFQAENRTMSDYLRKAQKTLGQDFKLVQCEFLALSK